MAAALAVLLEACTCRVDPPSEPPPDDPPIDTHVIRDSAVDTAVEKDCPAPALEPNELPQQATALGLERVGCGDFSAPGDAEWWSFELARDDWLGVRVAAKSLGSNADVHVILNHESGMTVDRVDNEDSSDVSVLFPALAGGYEMNVREQNFQGGDHYFYEVLATVAKPPVDWTTTELEPNDSDLTAQAVRSGDAVFGGVRTEIDGDWFAIPIPEGKHTLTVDVDAFEFGSAADMSVYLFRTDLEPLPLGCDPDYPCTGYGCVSCEVEGHPSGFAIDPWTAYESLGDEVVLVRLAEDFRRSGQPQWYVVRFTLEGA